MLIEQVRRKMASNASSPALGGQEIAKKTEAEKAETRRQTEAHRSDKGRSGHEALRGKKVPTLSELSREMLSEDDLINFPATIAQEPSDRSAAIMAASLVEQALYVTLTSRLADPGSTITNSWFHEANAPFGTFAAKIKLGRALAIYGPKMEATLSQIKDIRNVFAHRSASIDFSHPRIDTEVKRLNERPLSGESPARMRFAAACLATAKLLIEDAFTNAGKELQISFP